jgi:lambda family phage portal protein
MDNAPAILGPDGLAVRRRPRMGANAFVGASRTHPDLALWTPWNYSPATAMHQDRDMLMSRIHDVGRNDGWASAGMSRMVDAAIGAKLNLSATPIASRLGIEQEEADDLADKIEDAFDEYANDPRFYNDAQRRQPLGGQIATAFRHRLGDGEAFGVLHFDESQPISTCLEVVHPDRCKTPKGRREGDGVRTGVELGKRGAPIGYHFLTQHPGERTFGFPGLNQQTAYVPRWTSFGRPIVVHMFETTEAGQVRGVPVLATVVKKLRMLGRYDEAELQAAVLNAVLAAFIESPNDPEQIANAIGAGGPENADLSARQELRTTIYDEVPVKVDGVRINFLAPGDKANFLDAKHPNAVYEPFVRAALRNIASALGLSYEQLSMDWGQVNYSSARAALIEVWRGVTARRDLFAAMYLQPIYSAWLEEVLDKRIVIAPKKAKPFREAVGAWTSAEWIGPGRGWVDPLKEANAAIARIASGLSNYKRECAEQGIDWKDNFRQVSRERRWMDQHKELQFSLDGVPMPPEPDQDTQDANVRRTAAGAAA